MVSGWLLHALRGWKHGEPFLELVFPLHDYTSLPHAGQLTRPGARTLLCSVAEPMVGAKSPFFSPDYLRFVVVPCIGGFNDYTP